MALMTVKEELAEENICGNGAAEKDAYDHGAGANGDKVDGGAGSGSARPAQARPLGELDMDSVKYGAHSATAEELGGVAGSEMMGRLDASERQADLKDASGCPSINFPGRSPGPPT